MTVDDDLLDRARKRAASLGVSVSVVINRALRRGLAEADEGRVAAPTVVYDPGTPPLDAEELARRIADDDEEEFRRQAGL